MKITSDPAEINSLLIEDPSFLRDARFSSSGVKGAHAGEYKEAEVIDKFRQIRQPRGGFPKQTSRVFSSP